MRSKRLLSLAAICAAVAALIWFLFHGTLISPLQLAERRTQDQLIALGHRAPESPDICFLGIDSTSLALAETAPFEDENHPALRLIRRGWPWSRQVHAMLLDRLMTAGAKVVVFDLLFPAPREGDGPFADALLRHKDHVVIGSNFVEADLSQEGKATWKLDIPIPELIPNSENDSRVGFVNFWADGDSKVRALRLQTTLSEVYGRKSYPEEPVYLSLAAQALKKFGAAGLPPARQDQPFRFAAKDAYKPLPLYEIFIPRVWETTFKKGKFFQGKIVVIGPAATQLQDFQQTLVGRIPGPSVHLQAMGALLSQEFYRVSTSTEDIVLIVLAATVAWLAVSLMRQPVLSLLILLMAAIAYILFAGGLFNYGDVLPPILPPLATLLGAGIFSLGYEFSLERLEKTRVRRTLERYVSRNVVREILDNQSDFLASLGGSRKKITVLFSDVRGFTAMSENADPVALVAQLNEYLGAMVDVVFRHNGTLDKFIGDAVMAGWGYVHSEGEAMDAKQAVHSALEMRRELSMLNAKWISEGRKPLAFGIGINHGDAIFGNIGSEQKMEPTVIGDAVNLGSRLEGLTKKYKADILISDSVADLVRSLFRLRTVDAVRVSGRSAPVRVYLVLDSLDAPMSPEAILWLEQYEQTIQLYLKGNFTEAHHGFAKALTEHPGDFLCQLYLERSERHAKEPPPLDWDGTETMTSK